METIDKTSHFAHEAVDKITSATNQAAEVLEEKSQQLKTAEQRLLKDCQSYIRTNPVASLGIAMAAGFVMSRLLSHR
jgi:ElaB/YqjD/DUF883 family membrane-anchored ribosome-binding protein